MGDSSEVELKTREVASLKLAQAEIAMTLKGVADGLGLLMYD